MDLCQDDTSLLLIAILQDGTLFSEMSLGMEFSWLLCKQSLLSSRTAEFIIIMAAFPTSKSSAALHRSWGGTMFLGVSHRSMRRVLREQGFPGPFHCLSWCGTSTVPAIWGRHDWSPVTQPVTHGVEFLPYECGLFGERSPGTLGLDSLLQQRSGTDEELRYLFFLEWNCGSWLVFVGEEAPPWTHCPAE